VTHEALEVRHDTELNGRRVLLIDMDSHSLVWAPGTAATHGTPASDPSQAARLQEIWERKTAKSEPTCPECHMPVQHKLGCGRRGQPIVAPPSTPEFDPID